MTTLAMPVHVALVDDTRRINPSDLAKLAGALNKQILTDFGPIWHVAATVGAYPKAPANTWAIHIQNKLDEPGALGYHTDDTHQPVSYVEYTNDYSVTVSHECLEMLGDPWGNRMTSAQLPAGTELDYGAFGLRSKIDSVNYLIELCDPPEATSYPVGGVALSDFLLPSWYRSAPGPDCKFSYAGGCHQPREVADGGYVSFGTASGEWFQVFNQNGRLQISDIGRFDKTQSSSIREWADVSARAYKAKS